jgi:uncharacterized protein involved in exopolysaccharide biosynthesis
MRVYGSSPLYNYVELIFRSKRLFIASIILTTLVVVGMSSMRSGMYNARALIVLSGSKSGADAEDAAQRGTVKYKLNLLNVVLKDPKFIETAFKDRGLDRGLTEEEFKKFCREATAAMQFGTGENILDISCRWKDARCADIIKAFYGAYALRVLDMETMQSKASTDMLRKLAEEYRLRVDEIDKKVAQWRLNHLGDEFGIDMNSATIDYRTRQKQLEAIQQQLALLKNQKTELQRLIDAEPQMIVVGEVRETIRRDPEYQRMIESKNIIEDKLAEERQKHQEAHPEVKRYMSMLADVEARIARMEGKVKASGKGESTAVREEINQRKIALQDRMSDLEVTEQGLQAAEAKAITERNEAEKRAKASPEEIQKYRKMTENHTRYMAIRDNLKARLDQAEIDAKRDRELHITEMQMLVEPEAEQEEVAKKGMMLFAAGPILGIIIAFAFSLLSETMDHSIRTPTEVEKYLGKPVLAVLPRADTSKAARRAAAALERGNNDNRSLPS